MLYKPGHPKRTSCRQGADNHYPDGAAKGMHIGHLAFEIAKNKKTDQGDNRRYFQPGEAITDKKIRT